MKIIKCDDICFKIKRANKYIWPDRYRELYYKPSQIKEIIEEIEGEYPMYKGKVHAFQRCLLKIK